MFTGEPLDANGLVYLRTRYYAPELGMFPSLDPVEGSAQQAMSLNRYGYVAGNVVNDAVGELMSLNRYSYVAGNPTNFVDPSGMIAESPGMWDRCASEEPPSGPNGPCPPGWRFLKDCTVPGMVEGGWNAYLSDVYLAPLGGQGQSLKGCCFCEQDLNPVTIEAAWENPVCGTGCSDPALRRSNTQAVKSEAAHVANNVGPIVFGFPTAGSSDPSVKTRGILYGVEYGVLFSAGFSGALVFEAERWEDIWYGNPQCGLFVGLELGLGGGLDPVQANLPALIWSTATLNRFAGPSYNKSGDVGFLIGGLVGGISESVNSECDVSAFASLTGTGLTYSETLGFTMKIPLTNEQCRKAWSAAISIAERVL
jgi:RHS repeat-associated protein